MKKLTEKNLYKVKLGHTVKANASSIAFLWKNWHYFYQLYPEKISADLIAENQWSARGFNTKGQIYLLFSSINPNNGKFDFFSKIKYRFFKSFESKITLEYTRINSEYISYFLTTQVKLPGLFRPLIYLLQNTADAAAVYINVIGSEAANLITYDPQVLKKKCSQEAYDLYMEYLDEETKIIDGVKGPYKYFTPLESKDGFYEDALIDLFYKEVKKIEKLVKEAQKELIKDLKDSLNVFIVDPKSALMKNRNILEILTIDILNYHKVHYTNTPFDALNDYWRDPHRKEQNKAIFIHMGTVRLFGNSGAHDKDKTFLPENYKASFQALLLISKWYISNYCKD